MTTSSAVCRLAPLQADGSELNMIVLQSGIENDDTRDAYVELNLPARRHLGGGEWKVARPGDGAVHCIGRWVVLLGYGHLVDAV